jgi:hypothetical protein
MPRLRPHGTIRQSQIITTFGPGAAADLPEHGVIIGGLEFWHGDKQPIREERLVGKLEALLELRGLKLFAPPVETDDPTTPIRGITAFVFPEWFVARYVDRSCNWRSRPLVHRRALEKDRWQGPDRRWHDVVPIRFVQACINGHISDIHWPRFVHKAGDVCRRQLWLEERGTSGDLADVFIRCDCGSERSVMHASRRGPDTLGYCNGARPWLGPQAAEPCAGEGGKPQINRLLLRSASDAYFPQILRVISIPEQDQGLREAVALLWDNYLSLVEKSEELDRERRRPAVAAALEPYSNEQVWAEIQRRRGELPQVAKSIKQVEIETLLASREEIGEDAPIGADFHARRLPLPAATHGPLALVDRVVLLHRVREVMALVGFTRFEPQVPDIDGELSLQVKRADLARETTWLPAVENRGEGFFISFRRDAIDTWRRRSDVQARGRQLLDGFSHWHARHPGGERQFPGIEYLLLHSLSHLLITAVSLECGYSASSIRERIYAGSSGYGILLSTGTPDSEGTLGGLVSVGRRIERHLEAALDLGRLCSNDPVCAQHRPDHPQEERFLHGAACHGCLLIAETSCERRNEYLDRALVVRTVEPMAAEFFPEEG